MGLLCLFFVSSIQQPFGQEFVRAVLDYSSSTTPCLTFSSDGKLLACSCHQGRTHKRPAVYIWDLTTYKMTPCYYSQKEGFPTRSIAFVDGNKSILCVCAEIGVVKWDVATSKELGVQHLIPGNEIPNTFTFSPDGKRLVMSTLDGQLQVVDTRTWQSFTLRPSEERPVFFSCHAFSHNGKWLAAPNAMHIDLWDLEKRRRIKVFPPEHQHQILHLQFSPDDKELYSLDKHGTLIMWEVETKDKTILTTRLNRGTSKLLACRPDGKYLVLSMSPLTIMATRNGDIVQQMHLATEIISTYGMHARFSPDGRTLATVHGGRVILWDFQKILQHQPKKQGNPKK